MERGIPNQKGQNAKHECAHNGNQKAIQTTCDTDSQRSKHKNTIAWIPQIGSELNDVQRTQHTQTRSNIVANGLQNHCCNHRARNKRLNQTIVFDGILSGSLIGKSNQTRQQKGQNEAENNHFPSRILNAGVDGKEFLHS